MLKGSRLDSVIKFIPIHFTPYGHEIFIGLFCMSWASLETNWSPAASTLWRKPGGSLSRGDGPVIGK